MPHPCPGERLHDLFREVFALRDVLALGMDTAHEHAGLRTPQVRTADLLDRLGGATVPDMAAALGFSRQGVQVVCNELRDMGLVAFVDNPRHKRSKRAVLTDEGRNRLLCVRKNEARLIETLLPDLDGDAASTALSLLRSIRSALVSLPENTLRWLCDPAFAASPPSSGPRNDTKTPFPCRRE